MNNNYFNYIVFLALKIKANYDDKFFITRKQFHDFKENIITNIENYCYLENVDDEGFDNKLNIFTEFISNLSPDQEDELLNKFVLTNSGEVYMNGDLIGLNADEPIKALKRIRIRIENYTDYYDEILLDVLNHSLEDISNLEILDAKKKINDINQLLELESKIEVLYEKSDLSNCNIDYYKAIISEKLKNIYNSSTVSDLSSYLNIINSCINEDDECDIYYKAIFSNDKLALYKINNYFMTLEYMKQADVSYKYNLDVLTIGVPKNYIGDFNDNSDIVLDTEVNINDSSLLNNIERNYNINYEFYSKYIELLDNYQNIYGKYNNLENTKDRLLYLIDRDIFEIEKCDYKPNAFKKYKKDVLEIIKDYQSSFNMRQLLYLITYYDLTKDNQVKRFFKDNSIDYNRIIHNRNDLSFSDKVKKLIKKQKTS